jgi:hypothetical protein
MEMDLEAMVPLMMSLSRWTSSVKDDIAIKTPQMRTRPEANCPPIFRKRDITEFSIREPD